MNMREAIPPMTKNCRHDDPFVFVLPLFMSTFLTLWALPPDEDDGSGGSIEELLRPLAGNAKLLDQPQSQRAQTKGAK